MAHVDGAIGPAHRRRRGCGLQDMATVALSGKRISLREATTLGLVVATCTLAWLAVADGAAGEPFHALTVLGAVAAFTAMHYLPNLTFLTAADSRPSPRVPATGDGSDHAGRPTALPAGNSRAR